MRKGSFPSIITVFAGGFKVWECATDLCEYIDKVLEPQILRNKRILEVTYQYYNLTLVSC